MARFPTPIISNAEIIETGYKKAGPCEALPFCIYTQRQDTFNCRVLKSRIINWFIGLLDRCAVYVKERNGIDRNTQRQKKNVLAY